MMMTYPNLELLEYKFKKEIEARNSDIFKSYFCRITAEVFPQTWASTALGFGGVGGSALTTAYTTVFHATCADWSSTETNTIDPLPEFHAVFFDDRPAYVITGEPNQRFFDDIKNHDMASVQEAKERYGGA